MTPEERIAELEALVKAHAERIAAQADALSRVAEKHTVTPDSFAAFAEVVSSNGPPDFSRPFSLTPPAVVQMPGQLGAPDGLPMGDPAPESLIEEDLRIRQKEQQAHN